ncbi:MAG: stalk domain-containing protein [Peptococcaceae bacterium]|nr:stalk domain-containing protein [Peptococcaceae bacterium]MDH7523760.1 stalk domain-containing protein [Peptococcaceae bacterium]
MRRIFHLAFAFLFLSCLLFTGRAEGSSAVTDVEVYIRDNVVARPVTYIIRFKTGQRLSGGTDVITVKFPETVPVSSDIRKENVSINSRSAAGLNFADNTLELLVPESINIMPGELVEVGIASMVINNPREAGSYQVVVKTSQQSVEASSAPFQITDYEYSDGVSKPTVSLSTGEEGAAPEYRIKFKTSVNGRLSGGDTISLTFPPGTDMPYSIDGAMIKINGWPPAQQPQINGQKLTLTLPDLVIAGGGAVEIVIAPEAGIKNPTSSSYNTIKVSTSAEPREITSFSYEVTSGSAQPASSLTGLSVTASPDTAGQAAAYTIVIKPGLLSGFGSLISDLVLTFPGDESLPDSIPAGRIKVNGVAAAGTLVNKKTNELVILLAQSVSSQEQITVVIEQAAGITNPCAGDHKLEIGVMKQSRTILSDWLTIKEASAGSGGSGSSTATPGAGGRNTILLRIGSSLANVDGTLTVLDAPASIINNYTMVPLRFVAEVLGAVTEYDSATASVTVKQGNKEINLWTGSSMARVNGTFVSMNCEAKIVNNRLLVPVRFVSENLGAKVSWDGANQLITITRGDSGSTSAGDAAAQPYPVGFKVRIKSEHSYVNLRTGPSTSYQLAGKLLPGQLATIVETNSDWYKIRLSTGQEAWVASWVVDVVS